MDVLYYFEFYKLWKVWTIHRFNKVLNFPHFWEMMLY